MIYQGNAITVSAPENGIAELKFDLQGESVNKFDRVTTEDFQKAVAALKAASDIKGLLVTSGKDTGFIVGADITEFGDNFTKGEESIKNWLIDINGIFNDFVHTEKIES